MKQNEKSRESEGERKEENRFTYINVSKLVVMPSFIVVYIFSGLDWLVICVCVCVVG